MCAAGALSGNDSPSGPTSAILHLTSLRQFYPLYFYTYVRFLLQRNKNVTTHHLSGGVPGTTARMWQRGSATQKLLHFLALRRQETWMRFLAMRVNVELRMPIYRYILCNIHTSLLAPSIPLVLGQPHVLVLIEHAKIWQSTTLVEWDYRRGNFCWMCWATRPQVLQQQRSYPIYILMAQNLPLLCKHRAVSVRSTWDMLGEAMRLIGGEVWICTNL